MTTDTEKRLTDDLVKQLRDYASCDLTVSVGEHAEMLSAAADAIDRLTAERDALQVSLGKMLDAWGGYSTPDNDEAIMLLQAQGKDYWSMQGQINRGGEIAKLTAERDAARERLQAIIDWADIAMKLPQEFNSHGVRNLDGPVFDRARELLSPSTLNKPE